MTLKFVEWSSAINSILSSIGQAPVTTTSGPQYEIINNILDATILDVLNEEWHFNTEKNVEFCPVGIGPGGTWSTAPTPPTNLWGNPFGQQLGSPVPAIGTQIHLDRDILRIDLTDDDINRQYDITIRALGGGWDMVIYDKVNHTDLWTHCIKCDVVYYAFFDIGYQTQQATSGHRIRIPEVFKRYIVHRASTRAATKLTNNSNLVKALAQQELLARASCMEYECNQTDASFFGFDHNSHYKSYRPYQAMLRR